FRSDGEVAEFAEAAAKVLDVLVDAEDFLDDEDHGERTARRRHGPIGRHLLAADGYLHLAGLQSLGIGLDGFGGNRLYRQSEAGGQRRDNELAAAEIARRRQTQQVVVHGSSPPLDRALPILLDQVAERLVEAAQDTRLGHADGDRGSSSPWR